MRKLTKKQKKMLDKWYNEQVKNGRSFDDYWKLDEDDNFGSNLFHEIDNINPCEIFYQNVENYIQDKDNK